MKKTITMLTLAMSMQVFAAEGTHAEETLHHVESTYYAVVKGLQIQGDTRGEEEGDTGYGFGIDLGYRLGDGLALEYDFSYAENTVKSPLEEGSATYYTHALDFVYVYEVTEQIGLFAKAGYEYEKEKVEKLDIDADDSGLVYGVGLEYALNHDYKLMGEYEHSTIEGTHGDSVFVGLMYNF